MITLLHLSDIHFRAREGQFDLDAQLRGPLLDDIKSKPAGTAYDGLLITGDIAFSGKKAEYERSKIWLNELYAATGLEPENTFMVPGNHDVDRSFVVPDGAIWNNHAKLRTASDRVIRADLLETQLSRDPACDPLAPLQAYNDFAQGYDCCSRKAQLSWVHEFPLTLEDGTTLRLHGLNSALTSDAGDQRPNLYVAPFQTRHLVSDPGVVEMILCHHPPSWLIDMAEIEANLKHYARIALFGHEHTHRSQLLDTTVELFAGAVHPAMRDPDWLPTYHVLQLSVEGAPRTRTLVVRIHSRELRAASYVFVLRSSEDGKSFKEYRLPLPEWQVPQPPGPGSPATPPPASAVGGDVVSSALVGTVTAGSAPSPSALRELLVHFHRLSTPVRYAIATDLELIRDGDDVPPREQWDLVFKRAQEEGRLAPLWREVARYDTDFARRANPFE